MTETRALPRPGERAPDFLLPTATGEFGRFYDRFSGNRVVLIFVPAPDELTSGVELRRFAAAQDALRSVGASLVAVTRRPPEQNAGLAAELGDGSTVFSDPLGKITMGYGADAPITVLALDRNQRVLGARSGVASGADGHAAWALDLLSQQEPAGSGLVTGQAPVLLLDGVLEAALCRRLIDAWNSDHSEGAIRRRAGGDSVSRAVDHALKKRLDHRLGEPLNGELSQAVMTRLAPEAFKAFRFRPAALERFCIGAYDAARGDVFRPHRDNTTPQTRDRSFAVTINLNDDYEGGGLRFPEYGDQIYRTAAGGAVVFSCSLLHEALPVTGGRRFAALSFMIAADALRQSKVAGLDTPPLSS